ncbi:MAG: hypothetical protein DDT19_02723 [Syntrophomonadaceae bacterium]|nr:hypothetical protein [Bacillota bacterium]
MSGNNILSNAVGFAGFPHIFQREDAQYIKIRYDSRWGWPAGSPGAAGTDTNVHLVEVRVYETPFIEPGELLSEVIPPRRLGNAPGSGIIRGSERGTCDNTDWSFNNTGCAGGWWFGNNLQAHRTFGVDQIPRNADDVYTATIADGVWEGTLKLRATGADPHIISPDNLGIDTMISTLSTARYVQVNMKTPVAAGNRAKLYWTTTKETNFAEDKRIEFNLSTNFNNRFHSYVLDMRQPSLMRTNLNATIPSGSPTATMSLTRQPAGASPLFITVAGMPNTDKSKLTIRITGTNADAVGITETASYRVKTSAPIISPDGSTVLGAWHERKVDCATGAVSFVKREFHSVNANGISISYTVDGRATNIPAGITLTIRSHTWAGTIKQIRLDPVDSGAASGQHYEIDSIRVLPHTSLQRTTVLLSGPTSGQNNLSYPFGWRGAGFVNLRFTLFDLKGDDNVQIWGANPGSNDYNILLRYYDRNSFPTTAGGWTGNLGWGYSNFRIIFVHTPSGNAPGVPSRVTIGQFVSSLSFYSSTVKNNDVACYGAWRGADGDMATFWKAWTPYATRKLPTWPTALDNYQGWFVDLGEIRAVNRAVVRWKSSPVEPGEFIIMGSSDCTNFLPVNILAQGGQTYIFAAMQARCIGVMHPIDGANSSRQDVEIELAEFEIYPAGDYVSRGNYYSQPYAASAHMQWIIPYPRDAYDIRLHFTKFGTQPGASADTSDIFRIYNDMPGHRQPGWTLMPENTLIGTSHGNTTPPTVTNLPTGQALLRINNCLDPTNPMDPNMRLSYNPLVCDTTAYPGGPVGGYRTPWLLAGNDGRWPTSFDKRNMGMRWKLLFTAPLGYKDQNSWEIDRYELYSVINPTLIQIDILARHGVGRERRMSSQTTKVQPPNLVFR